MTGARSRCLLHSRTVLVENDRRQDDQARNDSFCLIFGPDGGQSGIEHSHDQHAEKGADHRSPSAHQTRSTDDDGSDGKDMKSIWTGAELAGQPACDETPLGSYGSSTILLKNIQKFCTNCGEKVQMDAGIYADDQLGRITNPDAKKQMLEDFASTSRVANR